MIAESETRSLYQEAVAEAERHKWIESEKAGRDLGHAAIEDWNAHHWWAWCRVKWIEHLRGETRWIEFEANDFGRLRPEKWSDPALLEQVVCKAERGCENLEILTWAVHERVRVPTVVEVLAIIDINSFHARPVPETCAVAVR